MIPYPICLFYAPLACRLRLLSLCAAAVAGLAAPASAADAELGLGLVRQVPAINGGATVEGSIQMMSAGAVNLNGGATITGDLLVPGMPTVRLNGKPNYGGTLDGGGPATPSNYTITLNGQATLRNVVRRSAPLALAAVPPPPSPTGTRSVNLNSAGQPVGDWATLRNLTLNGGVGQVPVPPGNYGDFTANGGGAFVFGTVGATSPAIYNLQRINLNGQAQIRVLGPVVINLRYAFSANGQIGATDAPELLTLNITEGDFSLNGGSSMHAFVNAPTSRVTINGNSVLVGRLIADKLILNGGGILRLRPGGGSGPVNSAPVATAQTLSTPEDTPLALTLFATDPEGGSVTYVLGSLPAQGALTLADGGALPPLGSALPVASGASAPALRYTPVAHFSGSDSLTFRARDAAGLESSLATITLTVTPVNDLPVATPLTLRTDEDMPANLTLLGSDIEGGALTFAVTTAPARGSLTGVPPALTYHPAPDYFGPDAFAYAVTDPAGGVSAPALVTITVDPVNDAPAPSAQTLELLEDEPLLLVLAATDPERNSLAYALSELPSFGTLTLPDGAEIPALGQPLPASTDGGVALRYVPGPDYHGADAFSFTVSDDGSPARTSAPAAVTLTIHPVNDAPVAAPVSVTTPEDTPLTFTLLGADIDSAALSYSAQIAPESGTLAIDGDQATYTPPADAHGVFTFTYTVADNGTPALSSAPATVTVTVTPVNDVPVAHPLTVRTTEDTPLALTLTGEDPEGSALEFTVRAAPVPGSGSLSGLPPALTFAPAPDFSGTTTFAYTVTDAEGAESAPALVVVTVDPVNDAPVALAQSLELPEDHPGFLLTLAATDAENQPLAYALARLPEEGELTRADGSALPALGTPLPVGEAQILYRPFADRHGSDEFTFTVSDGAATSAPATVSLTIASVNDAPVALATAATTAEDTSVEITLAGADLDGEALTYLITTPPAHGTLAFADGTPLPPELQAAGFASPALLYTPDANYHGADPFAFAVRDPASAESAPALVSLTVTPVNDAPLAESASYAVAERQTLPFVLTGTDLDHDTLSYELLGLPALGTLTLADGTPLPPPGPASRILLPAGPSGSGPSLLYTPPANTEDTVTFAFVARDSSAESAPATITIAIQNIPDAPVADGRTFTLAEDTELALTLTATDPENDPLTYVVTRLPAHGDLTLADGTPLPPDATGSSLLAPGSLLYRPARDFHGTDTLTYVARDDALESAPAVITIEVIPFNDAPVAAPLTLDTLEDTPLAILLSGTDADEGDVLSYTLNRLPAQGTLRLAGGALLAQAPYSLVPAELPLTYEPASGYNGPDEFAFTATDQAGTASAPALVSLTVAPVNNAPTALAQDLATDEDRPLALALSGTDPDGDALDFILKSAPAHGALEGTAPARTYTPAADYSGPDHFTFAVRDPSGAESAPATVSITVRPINDAPVAVPQAVFTDRGMAVPVVLNGSDVDGDPLVPRLISAPQFGTVSLNGATATFTPFQNLIGSDSFSFILNDGQDDSAPAIVTITVRETNAAPVVDAGVDRVLRFTPRRDDAPAGRIVVNNDEWVITDTGFQNSPYAGVYARNLADFLTGGKPGARFFAYTNTVSGSVDFAYTGTALAQVMRQAGHTLVKSKVFPASLAEMLQYDAIFLCANIVDNQRLIDYVEAGGSVYLSGGTKWCGCDAHVEAGWWNAFLNHFGLNFTFPYNGVNGTFPIISDHPLLTGVQSLYFGNGNSITPLLDENDEGDPHAQIVYSKGREGLLAVYGNQANQVFLRGVASDDGRPNPPAALSYQWTQIAGASARIESPHTLVTRVTFPESGAYRFRLTANDGEIETFDEVTITLNQAPLVEAGDLRILTAPGEITPLHGAVADDGVRDPLITEWTKIAGPGNAIFGAASSPETTVNVDAPGIYLLQLSAYDGLETRADLTELRVAVSTWLASDDLIAWWPFNGVLNDMVTNGYRFRTISPPVYVPAHVAQGLRFASDLNECSLPLGFSLDLGALASGFSIEFWARTPAFRDGTLISFGASGASGLSVQQANSGREIYVNLRERANGANRVIDGGTIPALDTWFHVAITFDRILGEARIYIDGILKETAAWAPFSVRTQGNLVLGRDASALAGFWRGDLDELAFYRRPLSVAEIQGIVRAGAHGKSTAAQNAQPQVDAGPDRVLPSISDVLTLAGTATDDGLPSGQLALMWTQIAGPGRALFSSPSSLMSEVSFDASGLYLLQLAAYDGYAATVADTVEVRVGLEAREPASGLTAWWPLNGHPREVLNGRSNLELFNGLGYGTGLVAQALAYDGINDFARTGAHPDHDVGASSQGLTVELWIKPSAYRDTPLVEWGTATGTQSFFAQWNDTGRGLYAFLQGTDGSTRSIGADSVITLNEWQHVAVSYDRPAGWARLYRNGVMLRELNLGSFGVRTTQDLYVGARPRENRWFSGLLDEPTIHTRPLTNTEIVSVYQAGATGKAPLDGNRAPRVSAGPDQVLATTNGVASLRGEITDDELPAGVGLIARWSQLSGPGQAAFADPAASATTAGFSEPGLYVLQLRAHDGLLVATDTMEVRVQTTPASLPQPIAAWWPLNLHPREVVNGAPNFELFNGATYAEGMVGRAATFDGINDFARAAAHSNIDVGLSEAGFSIELWANPAAYRDTPLVEWGSRTGSQTYLAQWNSGRGLYAFLQGADGTTRSLGVDSVFALNAWQHVAFTYDRVAGRARLYRNGVLVRELTIGTHFIRTNQDFYLGARPRENRWFSGSLDEPTLYARPLSPSEILSIYQAGAGGKAPVPENQPPRVILPSVSNALRDLPLVLSGDVTDDGLPLGAALTTGWTQVSGPAPARFASTNTPATEALFPAAGTYVLRLTASDSRLSSYADTTITVIHPLPAVTLTAPAGGASLISDRPLTLTATATVATGSIERVEFFRGATLLGIATAPALDLGPSTFALRLDAGLPTGSHVLTARAIALVSGATTTSPPVNVTAAPYSGPEVVELSTPLDAARLTAPTALTGIVARAGLASWKLEYRLTPADPAASWTTLATGTDYVGTPALGSTPAVPGPLGTFDPTLLLNGLYQLRLSATSTNGTTIIDSPVTVLVEGNMKVGAFSVAFNDLVEQTPGLPITLTRTYDSRDRRPGDFGPGWHLSLGNIRVQKNRDLGTGWWQTPQSGNGIQFYDVLPIDDRVVTIVMPDGETHRFRAGAYVKNRVGDPDYRSFAAVVRQGSYRFYPVGDTTSTLEPITLDASGEPVLADRFWLEGTGDQDLYVGNYGDTDDIGFPVFFNPTQFRLTTADGTILLLDERLGLLELRDRNGNRLIIHRHPASAGAALAGRIESIDSIHALASGPVTRTVEITRHPDGRVNYISDLEGRSLDYLYDPQGRLASFTDREDNTTQFRYEKSDAPAHPLFHYLTRIIDASGLPALRCEYDDDGRLRKQIDADGRETVFDRGIDPDFGRFEKIKDRLGHETTYFYDERGNIRTKIDPLEAVTTYDYYPDSDRVKFEEDHYGNLKSFAYDARGNVTVEILGASRAEEPATATTGYITRTTYTSFSAPLSITDPDGRLQTFTYDPDTQQLLTHTVGQLAPAAHPEIEAAPLAVTTYTYHPDGSLWTVTDALGNITTTTYDYGFADPAYPGAVKRVTTTVVDPAGPAGSDPANAAATTLRTTYAYHDARENLLATVTPRTLADGTVESVPTRHVHDAENRLRFTFLPDGRISETRYTSFGQTDRTLEWPVGTDLTTLAAAGPSGPTTGARVTAFVYDARGNLERTTLPDGTFTATGYDAEGRPVWRQDARGYRTFTVYDELGRPRFTIAPDADDGTFDAAPATADDPRLANNPRTETIYDLVGRVLFQIDEAGATTEFTYEDDCGCAMRRKQMIQHHPAGNLTTTYNYYPSGQVRSVTDPRSHTTSTRYDSHGRPVRTLLPATAAGPAGGNEHPATQTSTTYNVLGQRVAVTDQEGKITRHRHDALGRLVEVRQYLDQAIAASDTNYQLPITHSHVVATTFAYDEAGNQTAQIDARGHTTRYEHDALGRRLRRTLPATDGPAKFERLRYDAWGNLWQRDDFAGHTTTYGYDSLHRLTSKSADPDHPSFVSAPALAIARVEYDYDDNGAREAARTYDASGTLLYAEDTPRDERGRLDHKRTGSTLLDYDYHANGLLKDLVSSTPDGVNLGYRYDQLNRLAYVDDASRGLPLRTTGYAYNANGSLEALTHANGLRHAYRYDSLNRLRHLDVGTGPAGGTTVTGLLQSYDYRLRPSGHRREVVEAGSIAARTATHDYDDLYRLTGESVGPGSAPVPGAPVGVSPTGTVAYTLDKVGNREARTSTLPELGTVSGVTFNARDQLSTDGYDANGNTLVGQTAGLASAPEAPDIYDFEDRLIVRIRADLGTVALAYDADGLRIRKTILDASSVLVSTTSYLVCTNNLTGYAQVLEEQKSDASSTTLKTYTYGHDLLSMDRSGTGILPVGSAETRYVLYDGGGSVRALADESGAITDRYTYDAFGVILARQGTSDNAYLYRGEQYDFDLGLQYLRARFYNPDTGRFWNQDTYEGSNADPASLHKYNYANANPVRFIDPSGHMSMFEIKLMNFVIGVTARMGVPGLVAAQTLIANADKVSRGAAFVNSLTVSLLARGQSILVSGTRIIDAAGNFVGRFRIDLLAQRTTASNQQVNLMVEGKGVPWYLVGRPGWEKFLNQLTRQGQAFSQAVQTEGRPIHERVIVFSSKAPPGLEKAWAEVQAKIAPYYNRVFTSQADFEKWLDGL
jgi:RHS repeat-associated protein